MNFTSDPAVERSAIEKAIYWLARGVAVAAAIVVLCTTLLLAASWKTAQSALPAASPAVSGLVEQLEHDPKNAVLREQIRDLDSLARSAYFVSQNFQRRGTVVLLVAGLFLALALRLVTVYGRNIPQPATTDPDRRDTRLVATAVLGVVFFALAGLAIWLSLPAASLADGSNSESDSSIGTRSVPLLPSARGAAAWAEVASEDKTIGDAETILPSARGGWGALRGTVGDARALDARLPAAWDAAAGTGILWSVPVPLPGFNSPLVWGECVFLSGATDEERKVFAFDTTTGKLLWQTSISSTSPSEAKVDEQTGHAAATMACDANFVYAIFANGDLAALKHTGELVWCKSLGAPEISYGYASSLLASSGHIFVQRDTGEDAKILAFDSATGKKKWEQARGEISSWTSPVLAKLGERELLIVAGPSKLDAYDATTGDSVWSVEGLSGEVAPSPAVGEALVLIAMDYAGVKVVKLEDGSTVWEAPRLEAPEIASPLVAGDHAYILTDTGILNCVNMSDGKVLWTHEYNNASLQSSPLLVGDSIIATDSRGNTYIFKDSIIAYEQIAKCPLAESVSATPAVADRRLYFRTEKNLIAIGEK